MVPASIVFLAKIYGLVWSYIPAIWPIPIYKPYRDSKSHAFRVRLTHLGVILLSHAVRHHFSRILKKLMKIGPIAISQEPENPQKSMTYQNACTESREFNSVIEFNPS